MQGYGSAELQSRPDQFGANLHLRAEITMNLRSKVQFNLGPVGQVRASHSATKTRDNSVSLNVSACPLSASCVRVFLVFLLLKQTNPCCLGCHHHPVPSQGKPPQVLAPLPPPDPQTSEDRLRHLHHQPGRCHSTRRSSQRAENLHFIRI